MENTFAPKLLRAILQVLFVVGIVVVVTLPFMLDYYLFITGNSDCTGFYRNFIMIFLILVGIPGLWVVFELILMVRSINRNPFVVSNVRALKRLAYLSLAVSVLFFAKLIFYFTVLTLICGAALFLCCLFSLTLSRLFSQAVVYKEDNDLTI